MNGRRGLIALQVIAAVGIVAWWIYWFASGSNTHGTRCGLAYENSFPIADLVLAFSIGITTYGLIRKKPIAWTAGGIAAGMAFSLATLDTTHNLLTGGFSGPIDTVIRKAIFALVNGGMGAWTLFWLHRYGSELGPTPSVPAWLSAPLVGLAMPILPAATLFWWIGDGCSGALSLSLVGVGIPLMVLAVVQERRTRVIRRTTTTLVLAGMLLHTLLVVITGIVVQLMTK